MFHLNLKDLSLMKINTKKIISAVSPGILVAATGVGAGDLITAGLAGSELGITVIWAAVAGALLKWCLTEGLARWQLATGTTILAGWINHLGRWMQVLFFAYFIIWSFAVGGALINACGIAGTGILPIYNEGFSRVFWGVIHSFAGLLLIWLGGFRIFKHIMSIFVGIMFITVLITAYLLLPDLSDLVTAMLIPRIPEGGVGWTLGVLGGVGGTVTLLSYGYWIREENRSGSKGIRASRIDLSIGYLLTAFFGIAMVIIGSKIDIQGQGSRVAIQIAEQLEIVLGVYGKWIFLAGFWGAVFTSLLGVWQGVPYIFADFLAISAGRTSEKIETKSKPYRFYLLGISTLPIILLWMTVRQIQLIYAVLGAMFMPLLALTLLMMNNSEKLVKKEYKNRFPVNLLLIITLILFGYMGITEIIQRLN